MTDEKLEQIKQFFNNYSDLNEFMEKYINVNNPSNSDALIQLFNDAKSKNDVWELSKFFRSIESLRIDKLIKEDNITIEQIINTIDKFDLNNYKRIIISLDNKNYDEIDKLSNLGVDIYIRVKGDKGICTLEEFKKMREIFNSFTNHCLSFNLTNLEKITLAYDYVKFFSYNKGQIDKNIDSRSIAKSISTGYIVCEGYSRIFCQLLFELGITSNLVFLETDTQEKHMRVIVKVSDEKYNIKGIYVFDPTWDSNFDMLAVKNPDSTISYEISNNRDLSLHNFEKLPSEIRYLFYMIPLLEYNKYFPNERIEKIVKYPSLEQIELTDGLIKVINYNDSKPRDNFVLETLQNLLLKTKKIEGYSKEQIAIYIKHAIELLKQDRFGRFDKNIKEKAKKTL